MVGSKKVFKSNMLKVDKYGLSDDKELCDLIQSMMESNPKDRISPSEIMKHPYCQKYCSSWFYYLHKSILIIISS